MVFDSFLTIQESSVSLGVSRSVFFLGQFPTWQGARSAIFIRVFHHFEVRGPGVGVGKVKTHSVSYSVFYFAWERNSPLCAKCSNPTSLK